MKIYAIRWRCTAVGGSTIWTDKSLEQNLSDRVERRTGLSSLELTALILSEDYFGPHLDDHGYSMYDDLTQPKFVLRRHLKKCRIPWPSMNILFISPMLNWVSLNFQVSSKKSFSYMYYKLPSAKICCGPPRKSMFRIFADRFLPPPMTMIQMVHKLSLIHI